MNNSSLPPSRTASLVVAVAFLSCLAGLLGWAAVTALETPPPVTRIRVESISSTATTTTTTAPDSAVGVATCATADPVLFPCPVGVEVQAR